MHCSRGCCMQLLLSAQVHAASPQPRPLNLGSTSQSCRWQLHWCRWCFSWKAACEVALSQRHEDSSKNKAFTDGKGHV